MSISKVSDITTQDLADYLRIAELTQEDSNFLNTSLLIAKDFIKSYTGIEDLDEYVDIIAVVLVLVQDMYDTRALYVDTTNLNRLVETILGMHSINLLPSE